MTETRSHCLRRTRSCLAVALAVATLAAHAQVRATAPPNSGGGQLLQQVPQRPLQPPPSNLDLTIQPQNAAPTDSTKTFPVRQIEITGNTELPAELLHQVVAASEGKDLTLSDLNTLADRISDVYHEHGFPLATAYVPAQTIDNGVVRIDVAEARYGGVSLDNQSQVSSRVLNNTLAALQPGQPVSEVTLERTLLLMQDIPGAVVNSTLRPGAAVGTSDLLVDVTPQQRVTGDAGIDNFGDPYSGRVRGSANLNINGPFNQGDLLDFSALTSGPGMTYGRMDYRYLLNGQGTTLGATVSGLNYHLRNDLSDLDAHGSAFVGGVVLAQPLIRNTHGNLYGQVEYDFRRLNDNIDVIGLQNDRHTNSVTTTLAGDELDANGVFNGNMAVTYGVLAANNLQTDIVDQLGANTAGHYMKLALSLSRLQQLTRSDALYLGLSGQLLSTNLDTSEQFYLGGPDSVRGYDVGVLSGSRGYLATFEYRHDMTFQQIPGAWQFSAFVDTGWVEEYKNTFVPGPNSGQLSSAGFGVQWNGPYKLLVTASVAFPFGRTPDILSASANTSVHCWLQARKSF
ncbi:ShlB/FhaC/HecB family hemolysin secretion/activation protein [Paraburkholderia sp. DHOC27]|uniref:ShlB/FhaC/HecB family hemolysin secretion/activation protein n=1 Tax=Paraburkholderia sp. DHOC27 TaxID=2303330 RepID=UPI000E3D854F|nr:ShlB/FhaC/HecB family hemolysin secretion/activation protein [Paraburkholderia sp. DHOC27]RFU44778.1 ShlB/FhaC/HecB family hemolysin secretion/activation protein [Paraburkholderia sp. DHOC27]